MYRDVSADILPIPDNVLFEDEESILCLNPSVPFFFLDYDTHKQLRELTSSMECIFVLVSSVSNG